MTPYETWLKMCDEAAAADAEVRETLGVVVKTMAPGASGDTTEEELDALDAARERQRKIRDEMDAFIKKAFGR